MNKRTLSSDENENEKNKTGVKRYLMSNDDHFESQKMYHEKNCASKMNTSTLIEIKEDEYVLSDMNNNLNGNDNDGDPNCAIGRGTSLIDGNMDHDRENTKYGGVNSMGEFGYSNVMGAGSCVMNSEGGSNNQAANIYFQSDSKKRKGSKYSGMPFLKKEKNCVNTFLILKNVPRDAEEEDIKSFMRPFIKNSNPEILFDRDCIIVKLYDDDLNKNIYNYFNEHPTQIKGSFVSVKLSKLNDTTDGSINKENLDEYENGANVSANVSAHVGANAKEAPDGLNKKTGKYNKQESSRVILVSVLNLHYPVDIELIYYLFSKCGTVEKIITFSRNPLVYQALVQFQNIETAQEAIKTLHNRNIYDGCNTIQIQYSFLKELVVKANNSSSRDYTTSNMNKNKNLPNLQTSHGVLPTPTRKGNDPELYLLLERKFKLVDFDAKNASKTPVLICYNIPKDYTDVHKLFNLFSVYGFVSRIKILREKPDSALIQYSGYLFASVAQECLQHAKVGDQILELHFSKILDIRIAPQQKKIESYKAKSFSSYDQRYLIADQAKYIKGACKPTKTLFISNVSEEVTEECIMNLFMKYGEIKKLKIQPIKEGKKHITITVELSSEDTATRALMDLHNFYLKDRFIKVSYTKTRL
ncbi:polypyrimidine tract binding protein [Plasmodium gonderi]|uniref:Polypyrimidine tract binding protein n=1 Tax=Plasmodium gonderi TaxID=77519 RepID=A0A1Y1JKI0_PLAGO|nr:polypyrimidine tract binding protein [Plasmodium gonderi]GAW81955.1 polypyrimidine tract binding protein [Plasmodium gonderi]